MSKKTTITPLKAKFDTTPRGIDFFKRLAELGINRATFYRDLKTNPANILSGRLQIYAGLFDCQVGDLMDGFTPVVKPLVKRARATSKLGLKNA